METKLNKVGLLQNGIFALVESVHLITIHMKQQSFFMVFVLACMAMALIASTSQQQTFDKITVSEFELVDKNGKQRVSIKVEPDGEVLFRLRDENGTIRVKMGAGEGGSGLLLLDHDTNPGIHALAKKSGATLTVTDKDGKKKTY
jgi:hypothetical protein